MAWRSEPRPAAAPRSAPEPPPWPDRSWPGPAPPPATRSCSSAISSPRPARPARRRSDLAPGCNHLGRGASRTSGRRPSRYGRPAQGRQRVQGVADGRLVGVCKGLLPDRGGDLRRRRQGRQGTGGRRRAQTDPRLSAARSIARWPAPNLLVFRMDAGQGPQARDAPASCRRC